MWHRCRVRWRPAILLMASVGCSRFTSSAGTPPADAEAGALDAGPGTPEAGAVADAGDDGFDGGLLPGGDFENDEPGCGIGWVPYGLALTRVPDPVRGTHSCQACASTSDMPPNTDVYFDVPRITVDPPAAGQPVTLDGFGRASSGSVPFLRLEIDVPAPDGGKQTIPGTSTGLVPDWQPLPTLTTTIPPGAAWIQPGIHAQIGGGTCMRFDGLALTLSSP
jgi:hypothetical protein